MKKQILVVLGLLAAFNMQVLAKDAAAKEIMLKQPDYSTGKTVLQAMKDRHSSREFADKQLDLQTLSELLWAAGGISRDDGKKTAPTAMNSQEIDIYAFTKDGVYLYVAKDNKLVLAVSGDKRALAGKQDYVASAAVNLVYVSDIEKMKGGEEGRMIMAAVDVGHVSENVYLYCSSAGLACVIRGWVDGEAVAKLLNLKSSQKVIVSQSVGYKK